MGKLVELENISKAYTNKKIFSDISLTIYENQIVAILGGNGTGKSTLLRMIAGLEQPSSGKVGFPNKKIKIGYVPERFPKLLRFTPSEYLNYIGKIGGISKEYLKERIPYLLHRFKLEKLDDRWIRDLSKGNIQKVGILQAILTKPALLILDEPVSGLDLNAQQELLTVIKELKQQGTTIILTYHESNIFDDIIEKTYYLNNGSISMDNPIKNEKDEMKLIEVKYIDHSTVIQWKEAIHMESKDNRLLLYVNIKNSDSILMKILQLKGSIEAVSTVNFDF
ncbi:ABC transporter ATP-binding protein [Bacillus aquiflavi]|uniref:ABC transporter ATP-binding protein n=1 Tax=Bacillus aquiflavi TaxID=2672567 RepID=UPI001CA7E7AC|nr:ABC transporter ATP-binding protein [Bacillus aquiflavi]UAC49760.1 ABC transporter ATP-binding protein [Bacillus aquiflavi]